MGLRKKPNLRLFEELGLIEAFDAREERALDNTRLDKSACATLPLRKEEKRKIPPASNDAPPQGDSPKKQIDPPKKSPLKNPELLREAHDVILHLNKMANKNFRVETYESLILGALKKFKLDDLKKVIDMKSKDPFFMQNPQYLRPITLFGSERKIDQYLNEGKPLNKAEIRFQSNMEVARRVLERRNQNAK